MAYGLNWGVKLQGLGLDDITKYKLHLLTDKQQSDLAGNSCSPYFLGVTLFGFSLRQPDICFQLMSGEIH